MPENNQYPDEKHGTFTPVGIILVIAVCVLVGVFLYHRVTGGAGLGEATPAATALDGANPNQLAPASPAPAAGQGNSAP